MSTELQTTKPRLLWTNIILFLITTSVTLFVVPWYGLKFGFDGYQWLSAILCIGFCGMSITAGYHRLWSHRAYSANLMIRVVYALGGAFALQNSALHWASDHRVHHKHVDDNDKDPYSAKRGFWFSHIGWMLRDYQPTRYDDYSNVRDLQRDPVVMWQHRYYLTLALLTNIGIPLLIGIVHGDVIGMLLLVGVLRLVVSHHVTFFINSLAHRWGSQPYSDKNTARDNGLIAFFTFGEGYHNYHHQFQFDYRNGIHWWQFDPTKWLINCLSWLKLASDLRSCDDERIELARAACMLNKTTQKISRLPNAQIMLEKLRTEYDCYLEQLGEFYQVKRKWLELKADHLKTGYDKQQMVRHYDELKQRLTEHKNRWLEANRQLLVPAV